MISFKLNGKNVETNCNCDITLLNFLRDEMGLKGTKRGCEIGECGACTVLLDKKAVNSCMVLLGQVQDREIVTIEGLREDILDKVEKSLLEAGAVQCGYCTPAMVMSILGLLLVNKKPKTSQIIRAIDGNLCRCTGYVQIIEGASKLDFKDIDLSPLCKEG